MAGDTPSNAPDTRVEAVPAQLAAPETTDAAAETVRKKAEEQRLAVQKRETVGKESEVGATERAAGSPTEADNQAAEAIVTALDGARVAFGAKLDAFEATVDSNNFLVKGTVQNEIKRARQELAALVGTERGKGSIGKTLKEAIQARDAGDFRKTRQLLAAAQKAIMGKMDMIIAKKSEIGPLSQESKVAYTALADEASRLMPGIQTAFNQRETSLKAIEVAGTAPAVAKITPPSEAPAVTVSGTVAPTVTAPLPTVQEGTTATVSVAPTALPQKAQEIMAQFPTQNPFSTALTSIRQAIDGLDVGTNWFWMSSPHAQKKAVKQGLLQGFTELQAAVGQSWTEVQTALKTQDFRTAALKLDAVPKAFNDFSEKMTTGLGATPDPQFLGVATAIQKERDAVSANVPQLQQKLGQAYTEVQTESARKAATITPPVAPAETTTPVAQTPEEKKEEKIAAMAKSITDIQAAALDAYSKKPPDMGAMVMVAFQALALLMSALGKNGDILEFGEAMGRALKNKEGGAESISKPSELLSRLLPKEMAEEMTNIFRSLKMGDLYAFYKDPKVKPEGMGQDTFDKLKAFQADHKEEFEKLLKDLFENQGGKACAEDPDKKGKSVMSFMQDKLTTWVASLPAELVQTATGDDEGTETAGS
ncbi:MAG: hypothetical protein WC882_00750 [Candidatus Gracilibacteria bacterium]